MLRLLPILIATLIPLTPQDRTIDTERSTITIQWAKRACSPPQAASIG
jgi:hypothetical protein